MCPGWESNSVVALIPRNLLIYRGAGIATGAKFAPVGYSSGTHNRNF